MGVRLWISKTRSKAQMQISKKVRRSDFAFQAVVEGPNLNFVNMFEGPTLNFENPSRSELKFREKTLMSKCEFLNTVRRSIFKLRGPKHFVSRARLKDILIYWKGADTNDSRDAVLSQWRKQHMSIRRQALGDTHSFFCFSSSRHLFTQRDHVRTKRP